MCPSEHGLATSSFEIPSWFFASGESRDDILAHVPLNSDITRNSLMVFRSWGIAGRHTGPRSLKFRQQVEMSVMVSGGHSCSLQLSCFAGSLWRMTCSDLLRCSEYSTCALQAPPAVAFALHWCGPRGEGGYGDRGAFHCSSPPTLVRTTWRGLLCCSHDDISGTVSTHLASYNDSTSSCCIGLFSSIMVHADNRVVGWGLTCAGLCLAVVTLPQTMLTGGRHRE